MKREREREREREGWNQDMILEGIEARYDINYHLGNEVRTYRDAKVEWMVKSSECDVALERTMVHKERKCTWERERERERWTEELGKAKGLKISYRRVVGFAIINPSIINPSIISPSTNDQYYRRAVGFALINPSTNDQ